MYKLTTLPSEDDHVIGNLTAPVVLVEYGDFACPHSYKAHGWIKLLLNEFKDDLCYVFRHFPLSVIHPHAAFASLAAEAAGLKGQYWEMHEKLMSNHFEYSTEMILSLASELGFEEDEMLSMMEDNELLERISEDVVSGEECGITSTPAFFINGTFMEGPISYEILRGNIIKAMAGQSLSA